MRQKLRSLDINSILNSSEKRKVFFFPLLLLCYYLICFEYASLCNLIKLINILRKYTSDKYGCE